MKREIAERGRRHLWLDAIVDLPRNNEYRIDIEAMAVATVLYARANEDGHCYPSLRYIADHAKLGSTNTVEERIRRLEEAGLLVVTRKLRGKNEYQMRIPDHVICLINGATDARRAGDHLSHQTGSSVSSNGSSVSFEAASVSQLVRANSEPLTVNQGATSAGDPDGPPDVATGEPPDAHHRLPDESPYDYAKRLSECAGWGSCEQCDAEQKDAS